MNHLLLEEREQILVDLFPLGRAHAVRRALADLQRPFLRERSLLNEGLALYGA